MSSRQELLAKFYELDNFVTINVAMNPGDWAQLLAAQPKGGFEYTGSRFDWFKASTVVGYDLIRQAGLPYPYCNPARVFVNGQDFGFHINVELFKKPFIERNFGKTKGNL
ncbi:hypothetical protein OQA88_1256 [Cercophora sp. LCS_1]